MASWEVALVKWWERVLAVAGKAVERVPALPRPPLVQTRAVPEKLARKEPCRCVLAVQQIRFEKMLKQLHQYRELVAELVPLDVQARALPVALRPVRPGTRLQLLAPREALTNELLPRQLLHGKGVRTVERPRIFWCSPGQTSLA